MKDESAKYDDISPSRLLRIEVHTMATTSWRLWDLTHRLQQGDDGSWGRQGDGAQARSYGKHAGIQTKQKRTVLKKMFCMLKVSRSRPPCGALLPALTRKIPGFTW